MAKQLKSQAVARSEQPEYPPALLAALNNLWRQAGHCRQLGQAVPVLVVVLHPETGDLTVESHLPQLEHAEMLDWRHRMSTAMVAAAEEMRPKVEDLAVPERVM